MKPWLDSKTIRSLIAAEILLVLQWVSTCVAAGVWEYKSLVLGSIAIAVPVLKRMFDPDVEGPLAIMNRGQGGG